MKNKVFVIFLIFLLTSPLYSQTYQAEMDSLSTLKKSLSSEKDQLNAYTDSLANYINALDNVLNKNEKELAELKKELFIKKYGRTNGLRVFEGRIWKGMTEEMMRDVWGKPTKTNTDKHSWGVFTQYYYGDIIYFFKNSVLIDWQQGSEKKN
ncbi:MAG TPA: hypothetical protein VJ954_04060 [Ignavibacteriaceae bacterium]|nr:hypothetical protein [Ignavibacteriaceae bacterium]